MPRDIIGDRIRIGVNPAPQSNPATTRTSIALILHDDAAGNPDNGTVAVPLTVVDGDRISDLVNLTFSGGTLFDSARFRCYVDGPVTAGQAPPGRFEWETSVGNAVPIIRMALNRLGVLSLGNGVPAVAGVNFGGLQIGTGAAASGIYLGNSPNAATNVLDFYQEGTWTPAIRFGDPPAVVGITYNAQVGTYQRCGNWVKAKFSISLTSKGSSVGVATIAGLPFPAVSDLGEGGYSTFGRNWLAATGIPMFRVNGTTFGTSAVMCQQFSATGPVDFTNVNCANNFEVTGTLIYQCAT
jgi:hypothetical protein